MINMPFKFANIQNLYEKHKMKKSDIQALHKWLKSEPHLPELIELQLILFFHSCYFDTEATKTTIVNYCTLKTDSNLLQSANEETIRSCLSKNLVTIFPERTPEGYTIFMWKLLDTRLETFDSATTSVLVYMTIILHFHQNGPSNGFLFLSDLEGVGFGHMWKMNLAVVKQMLYFLQEAAPIRLKAIHNINIPPVTKPLLAMTKPFMRKEVYDSIKLHTNYRQTLYEYIPKNCLPEDLGGDLPSLLQLNEKNMQNILDNREFFKWHDLQKVDNSKKQETEGRFFGNIRGFFR